MSEPVPRSLAAYWRAFDDDVDDTAALELLERALADDIVFESSRLAASLHGRDAVIERLMQVRGATTNEAVNRSSVQRSGASLQWTWTVGGGRTAIGGTDVATLTDDGLIGRISVVGDD